MANSFITYINDSIQIVFDEIIHQINVEAYDLKGNRIAFKAFQDTNYCRLPIINSRFNSLNIIIKTEKSTIKKRVFNLNSKQYEIN